MFGKWWTMYVVMGIIVVAVAVIIGLLSVW
ncbi:hypothetical protein LCGC14_0787810 [marine sediment metagenome]|uniref:Uncharacterized protein n=1 Tax=marine sediment metagenome TaxID=412755 RepID=A0A0F9QDD3_9ZZZZ